jgi:hypothetical protein
MGDAWIEALPRAYRIGLRLRALGADNELIADCLEIDPDGVAPLLEIGDRKLRRAQREAQPARPHGLTTRGPDSEGGGRLLGALPQA